MVFALGCFLLFFALALVLQNASGIRGGELAHWPDEPAHVVTSLMIRDYFGAGFQPPLQYAESYYSHYPKVALGMWPPVFYFCAALWMLVFGSTKLSLLVLMAAVSAAFGAVTASLGRSLFGAGAALLAGAFVVSSRLVQYGTSIFGLDTPVAFASLLALWFLIRYFETHRTSCAVAFGFAASTAMLVKGNAIAVPFAPLVLLPLVRGWRMLRRPGLYWAAAIVVVFGLPWQLVTYRIQESAVPVVHPTFGHVTTSLAQYARLLAALVGPVVIALALVAAAVIVWQSRRGGAPDIRLAAILSLLVATLVYHAFMPFSAPDRRYLTTAIPLVALLACAGVDRVAALIPGRPAVVRCLIAAVAVISAFSAGGFAVTARPRLGFDVVAERFVRSATPDNAALICADENGEGAFIEEVAFRESRPGHTIVRASKLLSDSGWTSSSATPILRSPEELLNTLDSVGIDYVVVDRAHPMWPADTALLLSGMAARPAVWMLLPTQSGDNPAIQVFARQTAADPALRRSLRIPLWHTLGRQIEHR